MIKSTKGQVFFYRQKGTEVGEIGKIIAKIPPELPFRGGTILFDTFTIAEDLRLDSMK